MAATDVLTLAKAKAAVGASASSSVNDALIADYVTAVSEFLDQKCGPIVRRTVTETLHGGDTFVRMANAPIYSFTSVTEYAGSGARVLTRETPGVVGDYVADPFPSTDPPGLYSGRLWRRAGFGASWFSRGDSNVVVVAVAGRYADTAAASSSRFGRAAVILLKHLYAAERQNVAQVGEYDVPAVTFPRTMPFIVRQMLASDWRDSLVVG